MNPISRLFGLFSGVLLTFLVAVPCVSAQAQDRVYSMAEAKNHVGEFASVVGEVEQVSSSRKGTQFLNFDGRFPSAPFTAVVFASYGATVGDLTKYEGRRVTVTGKITLCRGTPEIIVKKAEALVTDR